MQKGFYHGNFTKFNENILLLRRTILRVKTNNNGIKLSKNITTYVMDNNQCPSKTNINQIKLTYTT